MASRTPHLKNFDLAGRVALVTGGAGLLGLQHAEALARAGARVVLADIDGNKAQTAARGLAARFRRPALGVRVDLTSAADVAALKARVLGEMGRVDILINNAALDPKVGGSGLGEKSRLENFPLEQWNRELAVGLTGSLLCAQAFGPGMAARGRGVILNIASDLSVIAPDQRLYRRPGIPAGRQPVKPVTYSVIKTGLVGLTRYLATYWADRGVRVNALSPGGVFNGQSPVFVSRLRSLVPLGRMAARGEYQGVVLFLCSDASSYMTGQNVVVDGGRSVW